jgi:hypothetical protein
MRVRVPHREQTLKQQKTMTKEEQYERIILDLDYWFGKKIEQLELVIDKENNSKILFEGKDGEKVELPEEMKKGFYFGIQTAIEVFGEFPVKISKTNEASENEQ